LRQLGLFSATALVISNMVGTAIFGTTGIMAGDLGSAGLILSAAAALIFTDYRVKLRSITHVGG
jgi:amino acid transporter